MSRERTVEAINEYRDAVAAQQRERYGDKYSARAVDEADVALLAAIAAEVAEEREAIATAIDLRWAAELEMRDQRRKAGDLEMSRMHADRAHVLREQAAAIRARKEAGLGEGN